MRKRRELKRRRRKGSKGDRRSGRVSGKGKEVSERKWDMRCMLQTNRGVGKNIQQASMDRKHCSVTSSLICHEVLISSYLYLK